MRSSLSWVAAAASVRNRQNPVKYLLMKAAVPPEVALRHAWVPGQAFRARIFVQRKEQGLSVPNVAVVSDAGKTFVQLREGGSNVRREVSLGARGPARSEVLDGLAPGDVVRLDATPGRRRSRPHGAAGINPAHARPWREALEELSRRKLRTGLTLLGLVFGVGAIVAMQAVGETASAKPCAWCRAWA